MPGRRHLLATIAAATVLTIGVVTHAQTPQASPWEKVYDRAASNTTAIAMLDAGYGLAIIGDGIERTTDGGGTWHETFTSDNLAGPIAIAGRQHAWIAGRDATLWRTDDAGVGWRAQDTQAPAPIGSIAVAGADEAWVTAHDRGSGQGFPPHGESALLHTTDGGATWQSVTVHGYGTFLGAWFRGRQGWLLVTQCHPGDPLDKPEAEPGAPGHPPCNDVRTLLHTADGGGSWSVLTTEPRFVPGEMMLLDATHAYSTAPDGTVYATSDGGRTWQARGRLDFQLGVHGLRFASVSEGWATGGRCAGGNCAFAPALAHTTDGGRSWTYIDPPAGSGVIFGVAGGRVVLSNEHTGVSIYDPADRAWHAASADAHPLFTSVWFTSRDAGYATTSAGAVWATEDGARTWTEWPDAKGGAIAEPARAEPPIWAMRDTAASRSVVAIDSLHAWSADTRPGEIVVASTSDAGATWQEELALNLSTQQAPELTTASGRLWLLVASVHIGFAGDVPTFSPLRTVVYARDLPAEAVANASPTPAVQLPDTGGGSASGRGAWWCVALLAGIAGLVAMRVGIRLRRRSGGQV